VRAEKEGIIMKLRRTVLKWRNKFSGEEGYVGKVSKSQGHFINTFDVNEAKQYRARKLVENDLKLLEELGESANNDFFAVEAEVEM
jgi:hypothetical protein